MPKEYQPQNPNTHLKEEHATTYRIGYNANGLYADVYYKHFTDAFTSLTVAKNTYQPVNGGESNVYGSTIGYSNKNIADSGIGLVSRLEMTYGNEDVYNSTLTEPVSKVPPYQIYLKTDYKGVFAEWNYAPKDNKQSSGDLNDVRIYAYNNGYSLLNIGYGSTYQKIEYKIALNNILNNDGRMLGSSVNVPERALMLSAKYKF